ncbi:basic-leucine zipper transcription factor [Trichoderma velutinum]
MTSFYTPSPIMVDTTEFTINLWPDQVSTEGMCPLEAFFPPQQHHDHQLFDTGLHHAAQMHPHDQQHEDMSAMPSPTPTCSSQGVNSVFFQIPAQQTASVMPPFSSASTPTTHHDNQQSPASTHSGGSHLKHRGTTRSTDGDEIEAGSDKSQAIIEKRERNRQSQRNLRQRHRDRVTGLEQSLKDVTKEHDKLTLEHDKLKLKLAKREAEVDALREILGRK